MDRLMVGWMEQTDRRGKQKYFNFAFITLKKDCKTTTKNLN